MSTARSRITAIALIGAITALLCPRAVSADVQYGDLQHLQPTATHDLRVSFVEPLTGQASPVNAIAATVSTVSGATVELRVNGTAISAKQLGKRTIDVKTGETRYFYYGVPLRSGPNLLSAVACGAGDLRSAPVTELAYGPGEPAAVRGRLDAPLVADGKTKVALTLAAVDRWGHAAIPGAKVRVSIERGNASFVRGGRLYGGSLPSGGVERLELIAGLQAGPVDVDATIGDVHERLSLYANPFARAPFVNGLLSIGAGSVPAAVDGDGIYDGGGARRERIALYGSGAIAPGTLLTFAYESQNRLQLVSSVGAFVDDPTERPFLTYGDASSLNAPMNSDDHLYARIDRGVSSVMWGQFDASIGSDSVGGYAQQLSGAKADLSLAPDQGVRLAGFTARNDVAFVQQALPVSGLASLTQPLKPDIVVGSDFLQLVSIDRRTGVVLVSTPLVRNVDYTIDYATGVLRFINVPLPYDANFNPQVIDLQYDYQGPGVASVTTGASVKVKLGRSDQAMLQAGYVNVVSGAQNFALFSQAISDTWHNGAIDIERANSSGSVPVLGSTTATTAGSGNALSATVNVHDAMDAITVGLQSTSPGYADPFGGLATPGLMAYHASLTRTDPGHSALQFTMDGQADTYQGSQSQQSDVELSYHWLASKKISFVVGLLQHRQSVGASPTPPAAPLMPAPLPSPSSVPLTSGSQTQAHAQALWRPSQRLALSVDDYITLSGSDVGSTQPSQAMAQVTYSFANKGDVFLRQLWSSQAAATFASSTDALTTGASAEHATEIGFERPISPNTSVTSDYMIGNTGDGTVIYSAMGVTQKFVLSKEFSGNAFVQAADSAGQGEGGFTVFGASLTYAAGHAMRASLSYQDRSGGTGGSSLSAAFGGMVSPGLSLLGTIQRAYGNGQDAIDDRISAAYRPLKDDRFTSLLDYTRSNGSDSASTASIGSVVSLQEIFRPHPGLELAGAVSYKLDGDAEYLAHTASYGVRVRRDLGPLFDVGAELQRVTVPSVSAAESTNVAIEVGRQVGSNVRAAVGYNFEGSIDPTLVGHPERKGIYVTVTSVIDRVFGWGKQ